MPSPDSPPKPDPRDSFRDACVWCGGFGFPFCQFDCREAWNKACQPLEPLIAARLAKAETADNLAKQVINIIDNWDYSTELSIEESDRRRLATVIKYLEKTWMR